ncbi:DUF1152 domain-containing protein [Desulfurococcaceae archaeon MEX13E-LK6-19]|nr:DUF1152 domain-containing protein [Desulfurococcaceae archaeon MEX13E-LK6-19]
MKSFIIDLFGYEPRSVMVFGIGGGGDVVTAATLALWIRRSTGRDAYIGSIAWERFVVDPEPGPIPLDCFHGIKVVGEHSIVVNGDSIVERNGNKFKPQVARVSSVVGEPVYVVDLWKGVSGFKKGLEELSDALGLEAFIAVDVGGDVLAVGNEDNLWSPLADSMGLAAFAGFKNSLLAVHGLGCDGELDPDYLLTRIAAIASKGGFITAKALTKYEAWILEKILEKSISEASKLPLLAYKGFYGDYPIRNGSRIVKVTPVQAITFFLKTNIVYELSPLAKLVDNTTSLDEANDKLNKKCIYTEYNLEKSLLIYKGVEIKGELLNEIRRKEREKLCRDLLL